MFEATNELGGRVWSKDAPSAPGVRAEYGAELIGWNHAIWLGMARVLGLGFTMLTDADTYIEKGLTLPMDLDGQIVSDPDAVWEAMEHAFHTLDEASRIVDDHPYQPWLVDNAWKYDSQPLLKWKESLGLPKPVDSAVDLVFSCNNTLPLTEQSYLAVLAQVSGGGGSAYWTDTEVMRCSSGNQSLATEMATALGHVGVRLQRGAPVEQVFLHDPGVRLRLRDGTPHDFDYVVLSAPPTAWHRITFTPEIGDDVKMSTGPAVKFITTCERRFWLDHRQAPIGLTDRAGETWEATDNAAAPPQPPVVLSVFAGAAQAKAAMAQSDPRSWYGERLERLFPGYLAHRRDACFVNWPAHEWIGCGYSYPGVDKVTSVAKNLSTPYEPFKGRLVFAGEHACPAFFGYMEGALESGLMAAGQIAEGPPGVLPKGNVLAALTAAADAGRAPA